MFTLSLRREEDKQGFGITIAKRTQRGLISEWICVEDIVEGTPMHRYNVGALPEMQVHIAAWIFEIDGMVAVNTRSSASNSHPLHANERHEYGTVRHELASIINLNQLVSLLCKLFHFMKLVCCAAMPSCTVVNLLDQEGFGFIEPEDGGEHSGGVGACSGVDISKMMRCRHGMV